VNHRYSPETKAEAIAAVLAGESVYTVAQRMGLPKSTVQGWKRANPLIASDPNGIEKKKALGEQVYGLLEDYIETLRIQVRVTRDEPWIKRQDADKLAILHGVLSDKAVRLLAAFRPPDSDAGGME